MTGRAELATLLQQLRTPVRRRTPGEPAHVVDTEVGASGVPVRIYRADDRPRRPILVYAHGGGWVGGHLDNHPELSPARVATVAGLPPAIVMTAALDVVGAELALIFNDLTRSQQ